MRQISKAAQIPKAARAVAPAAHSPPESLHERLRLDILNGVLKPGQILRQEELARRCNVSRVPLREAMSRLEAEGLVESRPRRGFAVTALVPNEIVQVFEMRAVIEEHAGEIAAHARTAKDIAAVELLFARMTELEQSGRRDATLFDQWCQTNYEFHGRIIASGHRKRLTKIAQNLRDTVEPFIRIESAITGDLQDASQEHAEIVEAFKAGDSRGLALLSRRHVESTAQRLLQGLRQRSTRRTTVLK